MKSGEYRLRCVRISGNLWHIAGVDCISKRQGKEAKEIADMLVMYQESSDGSFGVGFSIPTCRHCYDALHKLRAQNEQYFEQIFLSF